jgi:hypothetical protein
MRGWCFEIEGTRNLLNLYCGRVQWLSTDVGRLLVGGIVTACLALELGRTASMVHGRLTELACYTTDSSLARINTVTWLVFISSE